LYPWNRPLTELPPGRKRSLWCRKEDEAPRSRAAARSISEGRRGVGRVALTMAAESGAPYANSAQSAAAGAAIPGVSQKTRSCNCAAGNHQHQWESDDVPALPRSEPHLPQWESEDVPGEATGSCWRPQVGVR
jgi:hypothetical protein